MPITTQSIIDTAVEQTGFLLQWLLMTSDGRGMVQRRTEHATDVLKKARAEGKLYYQSPMAFFSKTLNLVVLDPSVLTSASIQKISSGEDDPAAREPFSNFKNMLELGDNTPLSWVFQQDAKAYQSRQMLENLMRPMHFSKLDAIIATHLDQELETLRNPPAHFCLYQWVHQVTMSIIAEHVLGLKDFPSHAHAVLDKAEVAVVRETESYRIFGYNIAITSSQQRYLNAKEDFVKLANELVERNLEDILSGEGYLSLVLQTLAKERSVSLEEAVQSAEVKKILACAAAGLLFASGTLSTSLTIGLLYLDDAQAKEQHFRKFCTDNGHDFWEGFLREALRFTSSAAHNLRKSSTEMKLKTTADTEISIPADSYIIMDHRRSHQNKQTWGDPENFRPERFFDRLAPPLHSTKFSPFSLGKRMCPGKKTAAHIFTATIQFMRNNKISIEAIDPQFKAINNEEYWTASDFVTRLRPGKVIKVNIRVGDPAPNPLTNLEGIYWSNKI